MRIFLSAGEPSGDLHAANLIQSLRKRWPDAEFVGYGGPRMAQAGAEVLFPLVEMAVMWFLRVLLNLPKFMALVDQADRYFRDERPDAVVLIDYPGLHWWIARKAKERGIPVFYYVPPQIWAWAGWRVKKVKKYVDHVLCSLPFEPAWYHERGVIQAKYVGHPYFDELAERVLDETFLDAETCPGGAGRRALARFANPGGHAELSGHAPRRREAQGRTPRPETPGSSSPACTTGTRRWSIRSWPGRVWMRRSKSRSSRRGRPS